MSNIGTPLEIPLDQLAARLEELPREKEVVAYCRGPYCFMAFEAVQMLRVRGWSARRLEEGFPEWRASGLPVVSGSAPERQKRPGTKGPAPARVRAKRGTT